MTKILSSDSVPAPLLIQLREWLESEWGAVDPFEGNHRHVTVPSPIVAVDENTSLVGGLVFSSFPSPQGADVAVWVNAVLVSPHQRKQGIASKLIQAAEVQANRMAVPELFVLSEFPALYQKLGWQVVSLDSARSEETILTKALAGL